jgi:hypothetical protein
MTERSYKDGEFKAGRHSFYIYCTVCDSLVFIRKNTIECANDHLKKCIAERHLAYSNPIQKNVKKGRRVVDEIFYNYRKNLVYYYYDYYTLFESRKRIAYYFMFNNAKIIQWAWRTFKLRPET